MKRPRGRPAQGAGVKREAILAAALAMLDEGGGKGLTMRALAARLGVTPMGLYHHVDGSAGLLRALSDLVYAGVLEAAAEPLNWRVEIEGILLRYHEVVCRHPQLTLAIFATPDAFAGVTRAITGRLTALLEAVSAEPTMWRDILVDHAHGSGLPFGASGGDLHAMQTHYREALNCLLDRLS